MKTNEKLNQSENHSDQEKQIGLTHLGNDFRTYMEGNWQDVYSPVRARMDKLLTSNTTTKFEGVGCVRRTKIGRIFAQLSRLLGSPLVRAQGEQVKTIVNVTPTDNGFRCWHRLFIFEDGAEQLVQTTKVVDPKLGVLDAVGKRGEKALTTKMRVYAKHKSIFFESTGYMLRLGRFVIKVPNLFTPGQLFAEHRDEGDGKFRYILAFRHPLWGETIYQDGLFSLVESYT